VGRLPASPPLFLFPPLFLLIAKAERSQQPGTRPMRLGLPPPPLLFSLFLSFSRPTLSVSQKKPANIRLTPRAVTFPFPLLLFFLTFQCEARAGWLSISARILQILRPPVLSLLTFPSPSFSPLLFFFPRKIKRKVLILRLSRKKNFCDDR